MALITIEQVAAAVRVNNTAAETAEITRLVEYATSEINRLADNVPDVIFNEAVIRIVGYLYDAPTTSYANAVTNSGAAAMLLPYRVHRAGIVSGADATETTGGGGGVQGGGGVGVSQLELDAVEDKADRNTRNIEANTQAIQTNTQAAAQAQTTAETRGVPAGGTSGQALVKASGDDYDTEWTSNDPAAAIAAAAAAQTTANEARTIAETRSIPSGGTAGQIIQKSSVTDFDTDWVTPARVPDVGLLENRIEALQHATRQLSIEDINQWAVGVVGHNVQVGLIDADDAGGPGAVANIQGITNFAGKITDPADEFAEGTEISIYVRAQRVDGVSIPKHQIRLVVEESVSGQLYYINANELEVYTNAQEAGWDYYLVHYFGRTVFTLGDNTGYLQAEYNEGGPTEYAGIVTGTIDDVQASVVADAIVPAGGTSGQVLAKSDDADYATAWVDGTGGGGGFTLTRLNASQPTFSRAGSSARAYLAFNSTDRGTILAAIAAGKGLVIELTDGRSSDNTVPTIEGDNFEVVHAQWYPKTGGTQFSGVKFTAWIGSNFRLVEVIFRSSEAFICLAGINSSLANSGFANWPSTANANIYSF